MSKNVKRNLCVLLVMSVLITCCFPWGVFADVNNPGFEVLTTDSNFFVGYPVYTLKSGMPITMLLPSQDIQVAVSVKRTVDGTQAVSVITALYDGDGLLQGISYKDDTLTGIQGKTIQMDMALPSYLTTDYYLRTFVWNGIDTMKPYNREFKFPEGFGWNISGSWSSTFDEHRTGMTALKVTGSNNESISYQEIDVPPYMTYKLNFYAKGNSMFSYMITDAMGNSIGSPTTFSGNSEWTKCNTLFSTGSNNKVRICFKDTGAGGTSYIDDISIIDNLLVNPDMEDGVTGWAKRGTGGSLLLSQCSSPVLSGASSLKIAGRAALTDGIQQDILPILLAAGQGQYVFTCNQRLFNTGNTKLNAKIDLTDDAGPRTIYTSGLWCNNTLWGLQKFARNIKWTGTLQSAVLYFDSPLSSGDPFCIDDASMVKVPEDVIVNGGLEAGSNNWTLNTNCFEVSSEDKAEGNNSLKVISNASEKIAYQELSVEPNTEYNISFSAKCSEDVLCKVTDKMGNITLANAAANPSALWKKYYLTFNSGLYNKVRICFQTTSSQKLGSYIDSLKAAKSVNLLENGNFEIGMSNNTEKSPSFWFKNGNAIVKSVTDPYVTGYVGAVTTRGDKWASISQSTTEVIKEYGPGAYKLCGKLRLSTGTATSAKVHLKIYSGDSPDFSVSKSNPNSEGWTEMSGIVDVSWTGTYSSSMVYVDLTSDAKDDYYVDDISLIKMP